MKKLNCVFYGIRFISVGELSESADRCAYSSYFCQDAFKLQRLQARPTKREQVKENAEASHMMYTSEWLVYSTYLNEGGKDQSCKRRGLNWERASDKKQAPLLSYSSNRASLQSLVSQGIATLQHAIDRGIDGVTAHVSGGEMQGSIPRIAAGR